MPATFSIRVWHGASPGTASVFPSGGRFHLADTTPTSDAATTPITIPVSGETFSYVKHIKLNVDTTPTGSISNLRFYSDGTPWDAGANIVCYGVKSSAYTQSTAADTSTKITGGVDITTYTAAAPLVVNAGTVLSNPSTGVGTQDFVRLQVGVKSTASPGTTAARALIYAVDET